MTDLEQRLRDALEDEGRTAPAPHAVHPTLRRVRRRQALTVLTSVAAVVAVVAVGVVGFGAISDDGGGTPAAPTTSGTLNGISITYPDDWALIDPDAAGMNGGLPEGTNEFPRLVLMLAADRPDASFGCPGIADGGASFLMSVQEVPLDLQGGAATPWPAPLEPMAFATTGGCYGGWEFRQAVFTTAGRSFDVRLGFAPDVAASDREALLAAYASMTFEPGAAATSVTLASGYVGDDAWDLIASRGSGGLELNVSTSSGGAGIGGGGEPGGEIHLATTAVGSGDDAATIVFGTVPSEVTSVEIEITTPDPMSERTDPLDVPDDIDPSLNAFVFVVPRGAAGEVRGLDADGDPVAIGVLHGNGQGNGEPIGTPLPDLADGRSFGFVRSVDLGAGTIDVDLAEWLSGDAADEAWQAEGNTGSVPNDHFVVNDDPTPETLPLAPDVELVLLDWNRCCDTFFDGDPTVFAEAVAELSRIEVDGVAYEGRSQWWITVRDGVVTRIEEQYAP